VRGRRRPEDGRPVGGPGGGRRVQQDAQEGGRPTRSPSSPSALHSLMAEWGSAADYAPRVAHLRGTVVGGLNGPYHLNSMTVLDDGAADSLTGSSGMYWFFAGLYDTINGRKDGEFVG